MDEPDTNPDHLSEILLGCGLLLATLIVTALALVLVWFATLRENQAFWTNAGGYPIWLRDLVLMTYLPLLVGVVSAVTALTLVWCSKICGSLRFLVVESLFLLVCWLLLATSSFIAFRNNLLNIIDGRELHDHSKN